MEPKNLVLQYLTEAHALETALVTNLGAHSSMTPSGTYKTLLDRHRKVTEAQAEAIERRINELGDDLGKGVVTKAMELARDAVGQALVLTKGPIDMIRGSGMTEKLLKNAKDEVTTEAQEIATYDALEAVADAAGDEKTAKLARDHRKEEEEMLAALRREIPKLALGDVKDRTTGPVKSASSSSSSTSTSTSRSGSSSRSTGSRSASGRSTSSGRSSGGSATKKASGAKKTTTRSASSGSSSSRSTGSAGSSSRSTGTKASTSRSTGSKSTTTKSSGSKSGGTKRASSSGSRSTSKSGSKS